MEIYFYIREQNNLEDNLVKRSMYAVADNALSLGAPIYRVFMRGFDRVEIWAVKGLVMPGELEVRFSWNR